MTPFFFIAFSLSYFLSLDPRSLILDPRSPILDPRSSLLVFQETSRQVVFIHTAPPDDRVELLKPMNEIEKMEDDCEEIHTGGLLKRYTERPHTLENVTLADWTAWYDVCQKSNKKKVCKHDTDNLLHENWIDENNSDVEFDFDNHIANIKNNPATTSNKKRSKARIIRSVWFNKEAHPEKHYRELIMLFTSWRNEQIDLIGNCSTFEERFSNLKDEISTQMSQYAIFSEQLDQIQENLNEINEEHFDTIAPNTQHTELQDETEGANELHCDFNETYDLSEDIGIPPAYLNVTSSRTNVSKNGIFFS